MLRFDHFGLEKQKPASASAGAGFFNWLKRCRHFSFEIWADPERGSWFGKKRK
jgi:hypothetical protein